MATMIILGFLSSLSNLLLLGHVVGKPSANGLTIKLIHIDSPASHLYPGNITFIERTQRLVNQSKARAAAAAGYLSIHPNEAIRAPIAVQAKAIYICEPPFPNRLSTTYRPLPLVMCTHPTNRGKWDIWVGMGIRSFVNQIEDMSHGTFSYCLKFNDGHALDTYISVPEGFRDLPNMTFHLRNAELEVAPQGTFVVKQLDSGEEVFCLAIATTLGAYQQTNQKFIYDITRKQLQFAPEDCAQNA
ncbi:hypothetical protein FH972_012605 [Carpinus fangiana]|uniref:Xylanase inhibitor C-terminal domain-containing protein n=1 Tax=Carpinus fangiana TaxID=176857 RepID=A0A5N6R5T8_9ROSI|nr:hypothetical protein FH972_012605 [Carpinus fangiana]